MLISHAQRRPVFDDDPARSTQLLEDTSAPQVWRWHLRLRLPIQDYSIVSFLDGLPRVAPYSHAFRSRDAQEVLRASTSADGLRPIPRMRSHQWCSQLELLEHSNSARRHAILFSLNSRIVSIRTHSVCQPQKATYRSNYTLSVL